MSDLQSDAKKTLKGILEYIGADSKYGEYAALLSALENFALKYHHAASEETE